MMMLLTYDGEKSIPVKMHHFYSLAYDTLYGRHDKSKSFGFERTFYTRMDADVFRGCFSVFCTLSYIANKIVMSHDEAKGFARKALEINRVSVDPNLFLDDLIESVSIMARDGLFLTFVHRSFQEFFVAVYANERYNPSIYHLIDAAVQKEDEVAALLFGINKEAFEQKYLKRKLSEVIRRLQEIDPAQHPGSVFGLLYLGLTVEPENKISVTVSDSIRRGDLSCFAEMISSLYNVSTLWPLPDFDWRRWSRDFPSKTKRKWAGEYGAPTDEILLSTPIPALLTRFVEGLEEVYAQIEATESEQQKMLIEIPSH